MIWQAAVNLPSEEETVTCAEPALTAVNWAEAPFPLTRTMLSSLLFQFRLACAPSGSRTALRVAVCCGFRFSAVELSEMPLSSNPFPFTVTVMLSTKPPSSAEAVIWVVPAPTAVTTPVELSMVATEVLLESQLQVLIGASAGLTEAVRVAVCPTSSVISR